MQQLIDKVAAQASQIGVLRHEKTRYEKLANQWEQRALKAEREIKIAELAALPPRSSRQGIPRSPLLRIIAGRVGAWA